MGGRCPKVIRRNGEAWCQTSHGANSIHDEHGEVVISAIHTYGDTIHKFVERKNYNGAFLPGFAEKHSNMEIKPIGLMYVDHCVGNVELGGNEQMGGIL